MVQVRKFTLINANGDRMPLAEHNKDGIFGINPKGLGVGFDIDADIFQTAKLISSIRTNIPVFEISVTFGMNYEPKSARELVFDLVKFLDASPYRLEYINDNGTYFKDCVIQEFPMTDLVEGVVITQSLKFYVTSLWYNFTVIQGVDQPDPISATAGKLFTNPTLATIPPEIENLTRKFPYTYTNMERQQGQGGLYDLNNDSIYLGASKTSPLKIEIEKPIGIGFGWELLNTKGQVIQSDYYKTPIATGQKAVVQSGDGISYAQLENVDTGITTGQVKSLYPYQDHERSNFVTAPLGRSTLRFGSIVQGLTITLRKEYAIVG